jgi:hypothetical protein
MQIDDGWLSLSPIKIPDAPAGIGIWEETQIPTASNREIGTPEAERRQRKFNQGGTALSGDHIAKPGVTRNAIEVVPDGEDTRVIHKAFFPEHIQSPETLHGDRITRRAVAADGLTKSVFQQALRAPRLSAKLLGCLRVNASVRVTVRRHFMATRDKRTNQFGMPFHDPAQHKESGFCRVCIQQVEDTMGKLFSTRLS